jgi:hypothetical protein
MNGSGDSITTTLDQKDKPNDEQNTGNDPNYSSATHNHNSFRQSAVARSRTQDAFDDYEFGPFR